MNPRHQQFAREYFLTGNASEAYRRVYPASLKWKPETVWNKASVLMKDGEVLARVAELSKAADDAATLTRSEGLKILTRMARGRIQDYMDEHGDLDPVKIAKGGVDIQEFSKDITKFGENLKIKMDQKGAIALIGKFCGWEAPAKVDHTTGGAPLPAAVTVNIVFVHQGSATQEPVTGGG